VGDHANLGVILSVLRSKAREHRDLALEHERHRKREADLADVWSEAYRVLSREHEERQSAAHLTRELARGVAERAAAGDAANVDLGEVAERGRA